MKRKMKAAFPILRGGNAKQFFEVSIKDLLILLATIKHDSCNIFCCVSKLSLRSRQAQHVYVRTEAALQFLGEKSGNCIFVDSCLPGDRFQ